MKSTSLALLLATGSAAFNIRRDTLYEVLVGSDPTGNVKGIEFFPNGPSVAVDWTIVFYMMPGTHSVVESTFDKPCERKEGGVDSGVFTVPDVDPITLEALPVWYLDFTRPETRFFFDEASEKCSQGAVFMTVPTQNQPLAQFIENAKSEGGTLAPTTSTTTETTSTFEAESTTIETPDESTTTEAVSATTETSNDISPSASASSSTPTQGQSQNENRAGNTNAFGNSMVLGSITVALGVLLLF